MKAVIDTCSLISLVRYYLPFDSKTKLYDVILANIESKQLIILDKIAEECEYTSKGIVIEKLDYIKKKKNQFKTDQLLPNAKFFNQLENQFINKTVKDRFSTQEFETYKNKFLESADAKIILYGIERKRSGEPVVIVTEETEASNDNKGFKKLPTICKILELNVITLPELLPTIGVNLSLK